MIRWLRLASCLFVAVTLTFIALPDIKKKKDGQNHKKGKKKKNDKGKHHDHPEVGPHGGPVAEWGRDEYPGELVIDHGAKQAIVYILDGTGKKAPKIAAD